MSEMQTETFKVHGKIGRLTYDRIPARDSETGEEYWCASVYEIRQGIWSNIGTVVAFAPGSDEARAAVVAAGLGGVPLLGQTEFSADGVLRGGDYAQRTTGVED